MLRVLLRHAAASEGGLLASCGVPSQRPSQKQHQEQRQQQQHTQQQRQEQREQDGQYRQHDSRGYERQHADPQQLWDPPQQLQRNQLLQLHQETDTGTPAPGTAGRGGEGGDEDRAAEAAAAAEHCKTQRAEAAETCFEGEAESRAATEEQQQEWAVLRPETAQNVLLEYEELLPKFLASRLPFGLAQEGRAWRREAAGAPRLLFRLTEFRQFEIEYFFDPRVDKPGAVVNCWKEKFLAFFKSIGLPGSLLRVVERDKKDLAHYALRCVDICYAFSFGVEEICGIAYRADVDLKNHEQHTAGGNKEKPAGEQTVAGTATVGKSYGGPSREPQSTNRRRLPHVVEPSLGLERLLLALLLSAFVKDEVKGKERIFLNLHPAIAPFKAAVMPVVSNVEALARESERLCDVLRRCGLATILENSPASIGRRYRRADELGVLYCVTVDTQTLHDNTVTVRWRNTAEQLRVRTEELVDFVLSRLRFQGTVD